MTTTRGNKANTLKAQEDTQLDRQTDRYIGQRRGCAIYPYTSYFIFVYRALTQKRHNKI